jgi:hypothetical protein
MRVEVTLVLRTVLLPELYRNTYILSHNFIS